MDSTHASSGAISLGRETVALGLAVAVLAVSARVSVPVPGSDVPQSLQTLAVMCVGAWLGAARGGIATVSYLVVGALGLPVFADGAAGASHLVGPTAGYLVGFVLAATLVGRGIERSGGGLAPAFALMVAGHVLVLGLGWLWLAARIGGHDAFQSGVLPFLWGGVVKSAAGAAAWVAWRGWGERTARASGGAAT